MIIHRNICRCLLILEILGTILALTLHKVATHIYWILLRYLLLDFIDAIEISELKIVFIYTDSETEITA